MIARPHDESCREPCPANYIQLRSQGLTIQAIAEHWHFATRRSVYWRLTKWRARGLLEEKEASAS